MGTIVLLQYAMCFFVVLLIIIKMFYPPLVLFLYLLFSAGETFGIANFSYLSVLTPPLYFALIMSAVISFNQLKQKRLSSDTDKRIFSLGTLAIFCALWIYMSGIVNGRGISLSFSWYIAGPCAMVIALAYYRDKRFRTLFLIYIFIQTFLGLLLVIFPNSPLEVLSASNYARESLELMDIGGRAYGVRLSGQFSNTVQLSYYAAVALAIGVYIAVVNRLFLLRIAGVALALAGLRMQFISLTRGVVIGLVFGFLLSLTQGKRKIRNIFLFLALSTLAVSILSTMPFLKPPEAMRLLLGRFEYMYSDVGRTSYRATAREIAYKNIFKRPIFGYGSNEIAVSELGYVAHEEPLALALIYGIPVGVSFLLIMILGVVGDLKRWQHNGGIYTVFLWTTLFLVMTNSTGGRSLAWLILAVVSIPWAEGGSRLKTE